MSGRLENKTAVVVGAGQTPGETIGNGRAMALLFAREGAQVLCVDRLQERAEETAARWRISSPAGCVVTGTSRHLLCPLGTRARTLPRSLDSDEG